MLKRLYPFMKPYLGFLIFVVVMLFLDLLANISIPWVTGQIIDTVFKSQADLEARQEQLYRLLLVLISSFFTLAIVIYLRDLSTEWFSQKTVQRLRIELFTHMQKLDMSFYHRNTVGELMSRATSDIEQVRNFLSNGMKAIIFNIIFFPLASLYMLYLDWRLTLLCLAISPVIGLVAHRFAKIGKVRQRYNRRAYAKLSAVAQESLNGIRVIQNFMSQDCEIQRFQHRNHKLTEGRQRSVALWTKYMPILEVLGSFSNILALTVGGYMAIRGDFSLGTWVQFTSYTWMLVMPMRQLGDLVNTVNFARVSSERLFAILDAPLHICSPEHPYIPKTQRPDEQRPDEQRLHAQKRQSFSKFPLGRGELEFRDVTWGQQAGSPAANKGAANNQIVLQSISFKVPAGQSLGIVGETGAGKTTLADLLCRFADPDSGEIRLDGVDLRQWDLRTLRAQISYVMQEPFLFSETLAFNISFNEASISQEKVIRSAQRSAAHGFIGALQQGYQTVVGERGIGLSGGQRQRTALARALVKEAPILILDDTTSAVDMETEQEIQRQLEMIDSHHTRIIIAHRISSVMNCDQIIVLKAGRIIERGKHAELLKLGGEYAQVFNEQQVHKVE